MPEFVRPMLLALMIVTLYFLVLRSVLFQRCFANPWITAIGGIPMGIAALAGIGIPAVLLVAGSFFILIERPCMDSRWPAKLWTYLMRRSWPVA